MDTGSWPREGLSYEVPRADSEQLEAGAAGLSWGSGPWGVWEKGSGHERSFSWSLLVDLTNRKRFSDDRIGVSSVDGVFLLHRVSLPKGVGHWLYLLKIIFWDRFCPRG